MTLRCIFIDADHASQTSWCCGVIQRPLNRDLSSGSGLATGSLQAEFIGHRELGDHPMHAVMKDAVSTWLIVLGMRQRLSHLQVPFNRREAAARVKEICQTQHGSRRGGFSVDQRFGIGLQQVPFWTQFQKYMRKHPMWATALHTPNCLCHSTSAGRANHRTSHCRLVEPV